MRANQLNLHIASPRMADPHPHINMLQAILVQICLLEHLFRDLHLLLDPVAADPYSSFVAVLLMPERDEGPVGHLDRGRVQPCLRFDVLPLLCGGDVGPGVDSAVAVLVRVPATRCCLFPVGVVGIDASRSFDAEVLNVTPC